MKSRAKDILQYKKFSNKFTKMKTRAKHLYYKKELLNHGGNQKKNLGNFKITLTQY